MYVISQSILPVRVSRNSIHYGVIGPT